MPTLKLTRGFDLCPEGTCVFRIYESNYDKDFGKIEVGFVNARGDVIKETFNLLDSLGEVNEKAMRSFSFLCRVALDDMSLEECDPTAIVNHFIEGNVVHTQSPSKKDPNKMNTYANIRDKKSATGWDTEPSEKAKTLGTKVDGSVFGGATAETPATSNFDINSFLNS